LDLLEELHVSLWHSIKYSEYWATSDEHRRLMASTYETNCRAASLPPEGYPPCGYGGVLAPGFGSGSLSKLRRPEEGLKRVDWLLARTIFTGLEKDDAFIAERNGGCVKIPDAPDVWVAVFTSRQS
jgi:hypothetical protein